MIGHLVMAWDAGRAAARAGVCRDHEMPGEQARELYRDAWRRERALMETEGVLAQGTLPFPPVQNGGDGHRACVLASG